MVTIFYFISFLASAVLTGFNIFRSKRTNTLYVLMGLCLTANTLGRYLIAISHTVELADWANKMQYFGACFTVPVMLLVLVQLCGFTMPSFLQYLIFGLATVTYLCVLTIGKSDIYYKSMDIGFGDGYTYIIEEYGPAHNLYPILMIACTATLIFYVALAIYKRNVLSYQVIITLSVFSLGTIVCYITEKIIDSTIEYNAVGVLALAIAMTYFSDRMNMYDMTVNVSNYVEREKTYGYIAFDKKLRYVNSNEVAREIFPEIKNWHVDSRVRKDDSAAYREIVVCLEEMYKKKSSKRIAIGERYFEISVRDIISEYGSKKKKVGYLAELMDETADQVFINTVSSYNAKLEQEVTQRTADIVRIKDMMVLGMAAMVESRDNSTGGHIRRTSEVVKIFARRLLLGGDIEELDRNFLEMVIKAAPMHDLGKIAVDDAVLRKQGKFTDEEYEKMKKHSAEGARIVHNILAGVESDEFVKIATNVAFYHHEKWDGFGYPNNLQGEEIPVEARIMALADVFDALVSKRCYKEAFSYDKAFSIIENDLGSHFDPELGKIFLECRPQLEMLYGKL